MHNEKAMLFTEKVKKQKVSAKYIKSVGAALLSLSFLVTVIAIGTMALDASAVSRDSQ